MSDVPKAGGVRYLLVEERPVSGSTTFCLPSFAIYPVRVFIAWFVAVRSALMAGGQSSILG